MPRDSSAAIKAWLKRKRAAGEGGTGTLNAVAGMSGGSGTRNAILDAHNRVKAAKEKLAAAPPPSVHGPRPKGGPMAGMATAARVAIGQKAAAKRRENKAKAEEEAKAQAEAQAKGGPDLFGRVKVDQDGSPLSRDAVSGEPLGSTSKKFFEDFDAHLAEFTGVAVVGKKAFNHPDSVIPKVTLTYADGTKGNFKIDDDSVWRLRDSIQNRNFSAGDREVAAYALDRALGLGVVPKAAISEQSVDGLKDNKGADLSGTRRGSQHVWADGDVFGDVDRGRRAKVDGRSIARTMVLDAVIGHTDRHPGNGVISADNKLVAIDNGLAFGDGGAAAYPRTGAFGLKGAGVRAGSKMGTARGFMELRDPVLHRLIDAGAVADVKTIKELRPLLDRIDVETFGTRFKMDTSEKAAMRKRIAWVKKTIDTDASKFSEKFLDMAGAW